jgi:transglutaminase-like putative cysteine protease
VRFTAYGPPVDYEVTMEPINQPWLFALEMPNLLPEYARLTNELQPVTEKASPSRQRYRARSSPQFRMLPEENADELAPYLALPPRSNPRTRELMVGWLLEGLTPPQLVERAMTLFRRDNFFYTLEPPLYDNNAVDEFLFDARRGFCEHYASAFVVMMRAARVPARVVTGYQGGDVNSVDGVFTVRQSDAHAWAEVWLAGSGWTRVDPTSAVSPARVERGMASALPQRFAAPFIARFAGSRGAEWLAQARLNWEALSNRWNQLVLNYSPERQRETLEDLGMKAPSWQEMVAAMVLGMGVLALAVGAWLTRRVRERDPVKRAWTRICDRLARQGIARAAHEGPLDFAARAATLPPPRGSPAGRAAALEQAARHYARLRYGPKPDKVAIAEFVALARTF